MPRCARTVQRRRPHVPAWKGVPAAALLAALAALAGCARAPAPPPTPPPVRPQPGYEALRDSLDAVDPRALAGRRVVLDPGHGGSFRGSLGTGGLAEAVVNLDVALALRDLLEARGANVLLTRDTDRDFLSAADSSLRADLEERVRRANAFEPDLFVSIHHNADARGSHDVNEIQTYHRLGDDGASLDAARSVHRYLVRNLSIERFRILPGNYHVLRGSQAPAILTEASYLTNPDVEARLALAEKRRLEAEALYLGIAHFFARRAPEVDALGKAAAGSGVPDDAFHDPVPALAARVRGGFDRVEMSVDGEPVTPRVMGDSILWQADRSYPGGEHQAALRVSLAGAGTSRWRRFDFRIPSTVGRLEVDFPGQPFWDGEQPLAARVRTFDSGGHLHRDTVTIRVRDRGTRLLAPADTVIVARDGVAWAYFRRSPRRPAQRAPSVRIEAARHPPSITETGPRVPAATAELAYRLQDVAPVPRIRTGFALRVPGAERLAGAPDARDAEPLPSWINRDGFVALPRDSLGRVAVPALRGYRAVASDAAWPPRFAALAGGVLHGRRIALDAEGGGEDAAGVGPSGARSSDLNLDVARALAGFLEAAGARVVMVRDGDRAVPDAERVRRAEEFQAERYLRIGHRPAAPGIGHWFGSVAGNAWALRMQEALARLGPGVLRVAEEPVLVLQQASSPALYVSTARVDSAADEERLLAPGALRAEAYALFVGLAREFGQDPFPAVDSLEVRDADDRPIAGAAVRLGGALTVQADAAGRVRFARTEPGALEAALVGTGTSARRVLLDSDRGAVLTGPSGR